LSRELACHLRGDSALGSAEVWKEARDVDIDDDNDDAGTNAAAAALDIENRISVQAIRDRVVMVPEYPVRRRPGACLPVVQHAVVL
jgi:hypothetical protein